MANSWLQINIKVTDRPANFVQKKLFESVTGLLAQGTLLGGRFSARRPIKEAMDLMRAIAGGVLGGNVWVSSTDGLGTYSTGNIACVQANAATDTVTFTWGAQTIVFTEAATGSQGFARGASNTTCALALASAISAHPVLKTLLTATPAVGNIALVSKIPGVFLQNLVLSTSDGTAFSFTQLTGGTVGTSQVFPQALATNKTA